MKKLFGLSILFVCLFSGVSAQSERGGRMREMLKDSLQFTDVQVDSVIAIRQEYQPQMRSIFMDESLSAEDKRAKSAELAEKMKPRLKAFLSDDQIARLEALQQRMRERRNRQ